MLRFVMNDYTGGALVVLGSLIIFASYVRQIRNFNNRHRKDRPWSSPVPFIGPLLVIAGYSGLPVEFSKWIFLVIVLDPDTMITLLNLRYLFKGLCE